MDAIPCCGSIHKPVEGLQPISCSLIQRICLPVWLGLQEGYDKYGYDSYGYDKYGYDKYGDGKDGCHNEGVTPTATSRRSTCPGQVRL